MPAPTITLKTLNYRQVRARWCLAIIKALVRRWLAYITLTIFMLGAFSVGAATSMAASTAWSVLLVFKAASMPWWQALPCWGAHVLLGAAIVLAWRPVLWRSDWTCIEKSLPLQPGDLWRSDLTVVTMALSPLFAIYLAGGVTWTVQAPSWLDHRLPQAWGLLLSSMAASVGLGMGAILWMRRTPRPKAGWTQAAAAFKRTRPGLNTGRLMPLWVLPLQRGPAQRAGKLLALHTLGLLALCGLIATASRWWAPWILAAFTLSALATTTRLRSVIDTELAPWHEAGRPLPLSLATLQWQRQVLALAPATLGLLCLPAALQATGAALRPGLALAFIATNLAGHAWQAFYPSPRARGQAAQWTITLVVSLALASEVFA